MKILLADDHPLFRAGVKPVLEKLERHVTIHEAVDYPSAFDTMRQAGEVDLVLMDLYMPGMSGIEGIVRFRATYPDVPLVVLSASEQREDIQQLLGAGALGFISKASPSETILSALKQVLAGSIYAPPELFPPQEDGSSGMPVCSRYPALSYRQIQVLRELAKGQSNKQIGYALDVTEGTVKLHLAQIFKILKVDNRTEAVLVAQKMGLDGD
ncbi:MAG: response regulator transcription factor [Pseudomonadota bacterium]